MIIKPNFLYKLFFLGVEDVSQLIIGDNIVINWKKQQTSFNFSDIKEVHVYSKFFFSSLVLLKNDGKIIAVKGLKKIIANEASILLKEWIKRITILSELTKIWPLLVQAWQEWKYFLLGNYINNYQFHAWFDKYKTIKLNPTDIIEISELLTTEQNMFINEIMEALSNGQALIEKHNNDFIRQELQNWKDWFDNIESYPLTNQQRQAVICDEDNILVIAGAGTGKTSTIVAKTGYLINKGFVKPDEILLLAFTNKSADELKERIQRIFKIKMMIRTFHSIGFEIISEVDGIKHSLTREGEDDVIMRETLSRIMRELTDKQEFQDQYIDYFTFYRVPYKSLFEFNTYEEYIDYIKSVELRALSKDKVKSFEECEIANWLFLKGISFKYESNYERNTADRLRRQYKPDFYLPDYHIYIEHFGVDREGNTAPFIDKDKYNEDMKWKRELHKKHKTILLETYSWERMEGVLLKELERKLRERGVEMHPIPKKQILATINKAGYVDPLIKLIINFLHLFKSCEASREDVLKKAINLPDENRNRAFLDLFFRILDVYEQEKNERGEIDFEDMILKASDFVLSNKYHSTFKYILIDEFQDISKGRARLIKALREQVQDSKLYCVGDDWQSIFRFAGSDISLMTNFSDHFGFTKRIILKKTWRFNNKILEFSSKFIQKNPSQIPKELEPKETIAESAIEVIFTKEHNDPIAEVLAQIDKIDKNTSILILGRYNHDVALFEKSTKNMFPNLSKRYLTVHKVKGLEADYVIVGSLINDRYGFPTGITDDPILNLVITTPDQFSHGEERRLFYVAVTRARKKAFLITDPKKPSIFINEIKYDNQYEVIILKDGENILNCPLCKIGILFVRNGHFGKFYGCNNYPYCDYRENICPICKEGRMVQADAYTFRCSNCYNVKHNSQQESYIKDYDSDFRSRFYAKVGEPDDYDDIPF